MKKRKTTMSEGLQDLCFIFERHQSGSVKINS